MTRICNGERMTRINNNSFIGALTRKLGVLLLLLLVGNVSPLRAANDSTRVFTEQHPLVYEDAWDLWPYVFLNEYGEAVGYNIDLLKLLLKELDIPCVVKLKPTKEALEDLKNGRSDLMLGMDAHFHDDYAHYGKNVIQVFTHSVIHKKDAPTSIKKLEDLAKHRVIVHGGSFSHHYMQKRGWGANAIPYDDMQEAVQLAHHKDDAQIVWNTLSLKWLIRKFQFDDLELSPINVPHGEYKFMSNNQKLLNQLDSVYSILNASGQLQVIQNKWFYPERKDTGIPAWIWQVVIALVLLTIIILVYYFFYRRYEKRMTSNVRTINNRLALILKTSHVRLWIYHVATNSITKFDEQGNPMVGEQTPIYFFSNIDADDGQRIMDVLQQMKDRKVEKQILDVEATMPEDDSRRSLTVSLSVLRRGKDGTPVEIIGTTSDVTAEKQRQQLVKDSMLRYQAIFNNAMVDTVAYDEHGVMTALNEKATEAFNCPTDELLKAGITFMDVLDLDNVTPENIDFTYLTQFFSPGDGRSIERYMRNPDKYYELQLVPLRDANGKLLSVFGTGRDVTEVAKSHARQKANSVELERVNEETGSYIRNIDYVMKNGGVRMVRYSPKTHMLTVYSEIGHVQYRLTQTRILALLANDSKRVLLRLLNAMDNCQMTPVKSSITTAISLKGGIPLSLYVSFIPTLGADGKVEEYFGMLRDISEIKATEQQLAQETAKAQEVEMVKQAFLRNMSYEIRTPLSSVVGFAELFDSEHSDKDETLFINEIKENSTKLLALINNILFLSRLDARMIEFNLKTVDFAASFDAICQSAWLDYQRPEVDYIVDNPFLHLMVDIDLSNLSIVINQIVANAAQNTKKGYVRVGCGYTGEALSLSFQDTGCGIPESVLEHIFDRFVTTGSTGTGLGLSICHDIVEQLNGRITIKSEVGRGTILWVTIPCKCSEFVKK